MCSIIESVFMFVFRPKMLCLTTYSTIKLYRNWNEQANNSYPTYLVEKWACHNRQQTNEQHKILHGSSIRLSPNEVLNRNIVKCWNEMNKCKRFPSNELCLYIQHQSVLLPENISKLIYILQLNFDNSFILEMLRTCFMNKLVLCLMNTIYACLLSK